MPVVELSVRYRRSLRFDDQVRIVTTVAVRGPSRLCFLSELHMEDRLCASAEVMVAAVNADGRPLRLPQELIERLCPVEGKSEVD
jgi:acyl-CoA thioesterase FadM